MSFLVAAVDDHARAIASHEPDRKGGAVIDEFRYRDGILHAEEVSLLDVATATGTPFYLYSSRMFTAGLDAFHAALRGFDHLVCFSVKANSNVAILRLLGNHGAGMDVVSGGEYLRAKAAGIPGDRIVFSGVGKTREEMALAIEGGIRHFNVESEPELRQLSEVATSLGTVVPIAVRINPDVDPGTHEKISTGKSGDKFGIPMLRVRDAYAEAGRLPGVSVVGIDVHIGSQITDLAPFGRVFDLLAELTRTLRSDGHDIRRLDVGGGLGINYRTGDSPVPSPADYGALLSDRLGDLDVEIDVEPGRFIAGNAGIMVSSVLYRKAGGDRNILILDSAMNDLLRPAMYGAYHRIEPVAEPAGDQTTGIFDIVGPICESGDTFARLRELPDLGAGDLVAFRSAGAYGAVMASGYNTRPLIPEILVNGDEFSVIRERVSVEEQINRDIVPQWLTES